MPRLEVGNDAPQIELPAIDEVHLTVKVQGKKSHSYFFWL